MIKAEIDEDGMPMDSNEEEEMLQYRKKVEDGVWQWIDALACRRVIANEYFANPPAIANAGTVCVLSSLLLMNKCH
jgi:hypothetical protein